MSIKALSRPSQTAALVLADGSIFLGQAVGATGQAVGEVVFNTSMTGYQEILTDPSYAEQMVTLTYPHIGNVGVNANDVESDRVWAAGLIIRELSPVVSNWRAEESLQDYLIKNNIVAIAGIDTRRLTRLLREKGAQHGCIMAGVVDEQAALKAAKAYPGIQGKDLARVVSCPEITSWNKGVYDLDLGEKVLQKALFHVVVYDFGVKHEILRLLVERGCRLTRVPAQTPASEVLALNPDGVFLSNGPGDPAACEYAIENIKILLAQNMPLFGICLGFQLMALACGAKTVKMKFGHHGANHPVEDVNDHRVFITSQNHSFAVDIESLPEALKVTHRSLFDGSLQGIQHLEKPAFAFQGHPEASPGPQDIQELFDHFIVLLREATTCQNAVT
jgi:carbamoyl-phosphate synthase small subunit